MMDDPPTSGLVGLSFEPNLELEDDEESLLESLATPDLAFTSTWNNLPTMLINKLFHLVRHICQLWLILPQDSIPFPVIPI